MFKSKLTALVASTLLTCCAIIPMGCANKTYANTPVQQQVEQNETNTFFSQVTISQANGDVSYPFPCGCCLVFGYVRFFGCSP